MVAPTTGTTGRLWQVSGSGRQLLRLSATLEHGTPLQVAAYVPAAVSLEKQRTPITDTDVARALEVHPPRTSNHFEAVHLPNLIQKLVRTCFLPQRPSNRAVDPIGHVLNKAWPMRCSVRNFSDIVSSYIKDDPCVYEFVCLTLHATMLGIYPTAGVKAHLPLRMLLHKCYVEDRISVQDMAAWVGREYHALVFVAIKEYIAFAVSIAPSLASVLAQHYKWGEFVRSVRAQADFLRSALNANVGNTAIMFNAAVAAVAGVKCFKCPPPLADTCVTVENIANVIRGACLPSRNMYTTPLRMELFSQMRELIAGGVPIGRIARACGIRDEVACILQDIDSAVGRAPPSVWRRLKAIRPCTDGDALVMHEFTSAWVMCCRVATHPLPRHIVKQQQQRLAMAGSRSTVVYACCCCKQLRAFVVHEGASTGNAWACGHQKVILDDCTGVLYCGKRVEKASTQSRRLMHVPDSGRSYWKAQQSMMCAHCPLLEIEMIGTVLSFYGKLYILCPSCLCVMCLNRSRFHGASARCINCTYSSSTSHTRICFHCCDARRSTSEIALNQQVVSVCTDCKRRWMDDNEIMAVLTEEIAHRAINERWGANRVSVHCARI